MDRFDVLLLVCRLVYLWPTNALGLVLGLRKHYPMWKYTWMLTITHEEAAGHLHLLWLKIKRVL